jgi:hypothetical protein
MIWPILFLDIVGQVALKAGEVQGKVIGKIDDHTDKAGRREEQLLRLH